MTSQITWHQCIIFVNLTIIPQVPNEMLTKSAWIQQFPFTNLKKKETTYSISSTDIWTTSLSDIIFT